MGNKKSLILLASEVMISEQDKLDPVFLKVRFKLTDNAGNLNHEGVTKAFINDLIERQEQFECLPMYVDMPRLLAGDYDNLTHRYNRATKKFSTQQFGSLTNFYTETDDNGVVSLYAEARFPKRELEACMRLVELYELGKLSVSSELRYNPEYTIKKDGIVFIDANEDNALTGMAIVSVPACSSAVALDMVAEAADGSGIVTDGEEPTNRGETDLMNEKEKLTAEVEKEEAVAEVTEEPAAEAEQAVAEAEVKEEAVAEAEPQKETAVAEETEEEKPEDEEDPEEKEEAVAEVQENAMSEVLEHSVDQHESVEKWGDKPVHVIEYRERVIETMEEAGTVIAELENQISELEQIKAKYDEMVAEREAVELAEKRDKAKAFAERQGLDVSVAEVQEAIDALDYTKIAELTMAQVQDEEENHNEPARQTITLASFVEMEVGNDNAYGGLLKPRSK